MDLLISFFVSVAAGVVSYYICKWLDGDDSGNQPNGCSTVQNEKKPQQPSLLGFRFVLTLLYHFLSLLVYHIPAATASIPHFFLSNHKSPLKKYGNLITFPLAELQPITFTTKRSIIYAGFTNSCFHLSFEISSFSDFVSRTTATAF